MDVAADNKTPVAESSGAFLKLKDVRAIALDHAERQYVKDLMTFTASDIQKACQLSGLSRTRLYVLLKKHNLSTRF